MALVVTVIVLLILAGISIGMLTGNNTIINRAGDAKAQTDIAQEKEILEQATVVAMGKSKHGNIEKIYLDSELNKYSEIDGTKNVDEGIEVTFKSGRVYIVDADGNVEWQKPREYSNEVKTALTEGKYVTYNGETYIVLYDVNSEYNWIEIVSVNPLDSVILGYSDPTIPNEEEGYDFTGSNSQFEKVRWSFNNSIKTLNIKSQEYLTNLADRTRCIGSNPVNPNLDTDLMFENSEYSYFKEWNNKFKDKAEYSTNDETQLKKIGAVKTKSYYGHDGYHIASHIASINKDLASFSVRKSYSSGYLAYVRICDVNKWKQCSSYNLILGFRPVIRLKDSIKITEGSGMIDSPYIIGL